MTGNKIKPQEFWISEKVFNDVAYMYQKATPHTWPDWYPQIHVIEYSAYEGAMASLATMEEANDFKLEELKEERAKHERVLQALEIAKRALVAITKRHDWMPEMGQCICKEHKGAYEAIAQIESLK